MKRKQLRAMICLLVLILAILCYLPVDSLAADNQKWEWSLEDGCLTISGQGEMLRAWRPWEKHSHEITSVVFEEGITYIAFYAFSGNYENLKQVTLPSTLETVGAYAFSGCKNLQKVTYRGLRGYRSYTKNLQINEGNDFLLQARWPQSYVSLLWKAFPPVLLRIGVDLLLAFFICRRVQKRRMRPPRDFSAAVNHTNL
jgi:hypothetical protein